MDEYDPIIERLDRLKEILDNNEKRIENLINEAIAVQATVLLSEIKDYLEDRND